MLQKSKNYVNGNGNRAVFLNIHDTKKVKKTSSIMQHTFPNVDKDGFLTANNKVTWHNVQKAPTIAWTGAEQMNLLWEYV